LPGIPKIEIAYGVNVLKLHYKVFPNFFNVYWPLR
jgi:hypothetical protein